MARDRRSKIFIIIFITIVAFVLALVHIAVYEMVVTLFAITSIYWLVVLRLVFTILCLSFITASILSNIYDTVSTRAIYRFAAVWLGFVVITFLSSILYSLAVLIGGSKVEWTIIFGFTLLGITLITGIYGLINARHVVVTRKTIILPNLPETWKGKMAVMVSDLHLGHVRGAAFASKVVETIGSLHPDIIFIAGDLYDGVKVDESTIILPFALLRPSLGIYFVTGNHEEFRSNERFVHAIRKTGIRVLMNEIVNVNGLQVIGVDDHDSNNPDTFAKILSEIGIDRFAPSILIKHQPTLLDVALKAGVSLQLSGHTHHAQMWPFTYIARWIYKGYDYGLHRFGSMQVYTSSGVGTWGPPMRIGTKAEIVAMSF